MSSTRGKSSEIWRNKTNEWRNDRENENVLQMRIRSNNLPQNHRRMAVEKPISIRRLSTDLRPIPALSGQETTVESTELGHIGALIMAEAHFSRGCLNKNTGARGRYDHQGQHPQLRAIQAEPRGKAAPHPQHHSTSGSYAKGFPLRPELLHWGRSSLRLSKGTKSRTICQVWELSSTHLLPFCLILVHHTRSYQHLAWIL